MQFTVFSKAIPLCIGLFLLSSMGECLGKIVLPLGNSLAQAPNIPQLNCQTHIAEYEKKHQIPPGLLHAISKVESGRKDRTGRIVSWPWTVNAEGESFFFATKHEAVAAVKKMQLQGIKSIDVGCMQVNLHYHPKAFQSIELAFDPLTNVAYAAQFLKSLKTTHASWHKAIAYYHSAKAEHHIPYRNKVLNAWDQGKDVALILADLSPGTSQKAQSIQAMKRLKVINVQRIRQVDRNHIVRASDSRPNYSLHRRRLKL